MPRGDFLSQRNRLRDSLEEFLNNSSRTSITLKMSRDQFEHLKKDFPALEASIKGPIADSYKYECTFKKTNLQ